MKTYTFRYLLSPWGWLAIVLALALSLNGCAQMFLCTTEASFNKDGTWSYRSCKNQENMKVKISEDAKGKSVAELETTATTPEAAINAAAGAMAQMAGILAKLVDQLTAAAKIAGPVKVP